MSRRAPQLEPFDYARGGVAGDKGANLLDDVEELGGAVVEGRTPWRLAWMRLRRDRVAMTSLCFIVFLVLVAIFAPLLTAAIGHGPNAQFINTGLSLSGIPVGPGHAGFLLGTDDQGRDVLSRI